jgi:3-oxoadipate enol-lactonase
MWDDVAEILRSKYRIVRYDKRGHGLSDCPPAPYSLDQLDSDLHLLFDHLNLQQAVVIGISIGGMIAMEFAMQHPDRVAHLVLFNTAARISSAESWQTRIDEVRSRGLEEMSSVILPIWFSSAFAEQHQAKHRGFRNALLGMPVEGYVGACAALRDADLTDRVAAIEAETLVVVGSEDHSTDLDQGQALAEAIPAAEFELMRGAGHLAVVEQPAVAAEKISAFLEARDYV